MSDRTTTKDSFHGDRVLVTGAASGIGKAVAQRVAALGAKVIAVDHRADELEDAMRTFDAEGHLARVCDLRDVEPIADWLKTISAETGPLYGLVHAAGIPCVAPLRTLAPAAYKDVVAVNFEAALALLRGFQHRTVCQADGGSVVLISSVMALVGSPAASAYAASKAAVIGLARAAAIELAPRKIRINCVAPGFVRTPMFERLSQSWTPEQLAAVTAMHPLGLGEAEDVASAVTFLLSRQARWITGAVLPVDGGYTAQ